MTFLLALASSVIAVVVGTLLAWCASMLPQPVRRVGQLLPLLPMVMPLAAKVTGFIFLLSPQIGYLNALLRKLPFLDHLNEGPFDIYSLEWIIILTGLGLSSFVYLFVLSGIAGDGTRARSRRRGLRRLGDAPPVHHHHPAAASLHRVCQQRDLPSGDGAVHGAAAARPHRADQCADDGDVLPHAEPAGGLRTRRGARLADPDHRHRAGGRAEISARRSAPLRGRLGPLAQRGAGDELVVGDGHLPLHSPDDDPAIRGTRLCVRVAILDGADILHQPDAAALVRDLRQQPVHQRCRGPA